MNTEWFETSFENEILLDVRSPGEFQRGHIPGAVSFPLFTDEERARVGTLYKQQGKDRAVLEGLKIVGPKLAGFVEEASKISPGKEVTIHCWRGGMRSNSMAWLLQQAGFKTKVLRGGYKTYRQNVQAYFKKRFSFFLLSGPTGSGKTKILAALDKLGQQTIDLEALACHKGSAFGALGMQAQPSIEQFENLLHAQLQKLDPDKPVWIEDESRKIGTVVIHGDFYAQMLQSPIFLLKIDKAYRIPNLVKDYGLFSTDLLELSVKKIAKRLGGQNLNAALEALSQNNLAEVAEIALNYYDKAYRFSLERKIASVKLALEIQQESPEEIAGILISQMEEYVARQGKIKH